MKERLIKFFGRDFPKEERVHYYDFIESYISQNVDNWDEAPDTDKIAASFASEIEKLGGAEFAFLLMTTGYIPEFYTHDSSQETLYSKLVEVLVCEWAKRIGFADSAIQKQKSSKEDVTIRLKNAVIVSDAKTFRLGRSQAAPNVKDTIKKADYDKWMEHYRDKEFEKEVLYSTLGGLITFPSKHRWKKGSDVILYCTDKDDPILILLYEYMTYMLIKKIPHSKIIDILAHYDSLFPTTTRDQHKYFEAVTTKLFEDEKEDVVDFLKLSIEVINELVPHKIELVRTFIAEKKAEIIKEVTEIPDEKIDDIKQMLVDARIELMSRQLLKQLDNIEKFRLPKPEKEKKIPVKKTTQKKKYAASEELPLAAEDPAEFTKDEDIVDRPSHEDDEDGDTYDDESES